MYNTYRAVSNYKKKKLNLKGELAEFIRNKINFYFGRRCDE